MRTSRVVFVLGLGLAGGCNAALGIDEAVPRDTQANLSQEVPVSECNMPSTSCAKCFDDNCGKALGDCLGDQACRKVLNAYRSCLGASCNNTGCLELLQPVSELLGDCIQTECWDCMGKPIVEMCDLYCACMQDQLPKSSETCESYDLSQGQDPPSWSAGDLATCQVECQKLSLTSASCRWSHCELAVSGEVPTHCRHAVSSLNCPLQQELGTCTDRRPGGFGCTAPSDCCSGVCANHFCAN